MQKLASNAGPNKILNHKYPLPNIVLAVFYFLNQKKYNKFKKIIY